MKKLLLTVLLMTTVLGLSGCGSSAAQGNDMKDAPKMEDTMKEDNKSGDMMTEDSKSGDMMKDDSKSSDMMEKDTKK